MGEEKGLTHKIRQYWWIIDERVMEGGDCFDLLQKQKTQLSQ
jgi:hypothetical protein